MQRAALASLALGQLLVKQPVIYGGAKLDQEPPLDVCAGLELPAQVYVSPQPTSGWVREGYIETKDGAALASWSQTAYGEETSAIVHVPTADGKVLVTLDAQIADPDGEERIRGHGMAEKTTVIEGRDCDGRLMFVIHELAGVKAPLEVYDAEMKLLAKGVAGELNPMQFYWTDGRKAVGGDEALATVTMAKPGADINSFGGLEHFGFDYETGVADIRANPLLDPYNRWVLIVATLVRELRNADRDEDGVVEEGPFRMWIVTWAALKYVALSAGVVFAIAAIYFWVYDPEAIVFLVEKHERSRLVKKSKNIAAEAPNEVDPASGKWWDGFWTGLNAQGSSADRYFRP
jgi:hypothetical protein